MIIRRLSDDNVVAISQESHADVAAQFAAHWGNDRFARLEPYQSMLFGTVYHDSGHRDMEANLPIDPQTGLPYNFRGAPPEVRNRESDNVNSLWIRDRDPYAALVVSMHHSGLRKRRYDTLRLRKLGGAPAAMPEGPPLGSDDAFADLQGWQRDVADELEIENGLRDLFWHNYQLLQAFDLLSLHFCCDGYTGEELQPVVLERVPVRPGADELVDISIEPVGRDAARFDPYPFDRPALEIATLGRTMHPGKGASDAAVKEAYHQADRCLLAWQISN